MDALQVTQIVVEDHTTPSTPARSAKPAPLSLSDAERHAAFTREVRCLFDAAIARLASKSNSGRLDRIALSQEIARSEEHTSELQSLMRISYAVFCLKKK